MTELNLIKVYQFFKIIEENEPGLKLFTKVNEIFVIPDINIFYDFILNITMGYEDNPPIKDACINLFMLHNITHNSEVLLEKFKPAFWDIFDYDVEYLEEKDGCDDPMYVVMAYTPEEIAINSITTTLTPSQQEIRHTYFRNRRIAIDIIIDNYERQLRKLQNK